MDFYIKFNKILIFFNIVFVISLIESKTYNQLDKFSNCEKLIKMYKQQKYSSEEYCVPNYQNVNSKCNDDNYRNKVIDVCKNELLKWYERRTNTTFDFENPKTYNEKIQWMKIYDNTPLKTKLTDKYLVREWIKEKIGEQYLVKLLGVWESFDDINFDLLPNKFILKANHGCEMNIIVKNKTILNIPEARKKFNLWMKQNYAFFSYEFQYLNIKPKIIAEEYLENENNELYDYKVFCFNGKVNSIGFFSNRVNHETKLAFYDLNWNKLNYTFYNIDEKVMPKPKNLKLLIDLSEKLSQGFSHVRVDFYILNDESIKFGEMTFSTHSGTAKWSPPEQNKIFGDMIQLYDKSPFPL